MRFYNRTRRSRSIPRKLMLQGRVLELPLYYLVRASDLGREGIENSGSHRFADHIYRDRPSGRGPWGRWLDARLLSMPAVRSFRNRYLASRDQLCRFLAERGPAGRAIDVLSAPCGIPRELVEGARLYRERTGRTLSGVTFHGLDLDPEVLDEAAEFAIAGGLPHFEAHHGDALERASYPAEVDFITCTGLGEFLDDDRLERLYRVFREVLRPGGWLVTSGMKRMRIPDYLLKLAELETNYRRPDQLEAIARRAGFTRIETRLDEFGIQALLTARM